MSTPIAEIGAFEAKTKLSSILAQVEKGKSFYITKHGRRTSLAGSSACVPWRRPCFA